MIVIIYSVVRVIIHIVNDTFIVPVAKTEEVGI